MTSNFYQFILPHQSEKKLRILYFFIFQKSIQEIQKGMGYDLDNVSIFVGRFMSLSGLWTKKWDIFCPVFRLTFFIRIAKQKPQAVAPKAVCFSILFFA